MKLTLTSRARALLFFLSAAAYTAWFSGLGERSDAAVVATDGVLDAAATLFTRPPEVATSILRDPFDGAPSHAMPIAADEVSMPLGANDGTPQRIANSASGVVVPNIGDASSTGITTALVVRATIVGRNPVAYVENGTTMDIVRVGDTIGDRRVASIDLSGLTFADGSRIDLAGAPQPTPGPTLHPATVEQRLDDLRKLIVHLNGPRLQPVTAATAGATPSPSARFPSPAPLASVDTRGIAVGANPTSDPNAPTPYPDPYPYAPAR